MRDFGLFDSRFLAAAKLPTKLRGWRALGIPLSLIPLFILTACGTTPKDTSPRPYTSSEAQGIHDLWIPPKSSECKILIDTFQAVEQALSDFVNAQDSVSRDKARETSASVLKAAVALTALLSNQSNDKLIQTYSLKLSDSFKKLANLNSVSTGEMVKLITNFKGLVTTPPLPCRNQANL
jgi:hypothetical protein